MEKNAKLFDSIIQPTNKNRTKSLSVRFGDGYEQKVQDGINNDLLTDLTFEEK